MDKRKLAEEIFRAAVESVMPDKIVRKHVKLKDNWLTLANSNYDLNEISNIYVIGAGKASGLMAYELENILCNHIKAGEVIVKYGHACNTRIINISEAAHPIPDMNGFIATERLLLLAQKAQKNDLVICLISGGGSALLTDCVAGVQLNDLIILNNLLLNCGANIHEINVVRKHLSNIKGGQLAKAIYPATVVSLILSDVIGDSLDVIASGPTVPDKTTFFDALNVLKKYNLLQAVPANIIHYLIQGANDKINETPKPNNSIFENVSNYIIGSNEIALQAALKKANEKGLEAIVVEKEIDGDTIEAAEYIIETAFNAREDELLQRPACLLFGGETTLLIEGNGSGGRNQHMALFAAMMLKDKKGYTFLAAGTDGTDGATDAAGAIVDGNTLNALLSLKKDPLLYFRNFDSYNFFKHTGGHIITGPTKTNVMDLMLVIVE